MNHASRKGTLQELHAETTQQICSCCSDFASCAEERHVLHAGHWMRVKDFLRWLYA